MSNKNGSKWIRPEKRLAIYSRDGFACVYCGADEKLTLDHLQPRELGGTHAHENLVSACLSCNSTRQDAGLRTWFAMLRDRGINTAKLSSKIRTLTAKQLDIEQGKRLLAARKGA